MTDETSGRIDGLENIAKFYGISESTLRRRHLKAMDKADVIIKFDKGRRRQQVWVSWPLLLIQYARAVKHKGRHM